MREPGVRDTKFMDVEFDVWLVSSSIDPIFIVVVCFVVEIQHFVCDRTTPPKEITVQRRFYARVWRFRTLYMNWKSITVFIRIVAAAIINFSLAGVRLPIEGGSYSRTALFISEGYLWADPVVSCCDRLVFQDYFSNRRVIMIEKQQQNQARDVFCHAFASN